MIQLDNQSQWAAELYPGWSRAGQRQQTLVVKTAYSFTADGKLTPLPHTPIIDADSYRGKPESSSLITASEIAPFKKGGEIYLFGSAQPGGTRQQVVKVAASLAQGSRTIWTKELRVFGKRRWQRRLLTALPGPAEPISEPVPLIYENSYGGSNPRHPDQTYAANPAGVGFSLRGLRTSGLQLPAIEQPPTFITGPASRVVPAGFGPLPPHWSPRSELAMETDEEALAYGYGAPFISELPADFYNCAPLDQRLDAPFLPGLHLKLTNLVAGAPHDLVIALPKQAPRALLEIGQNVIPLKLACDTIVADTDNQQVVLIYRQAINMTPSTTEFTGGMVQNRWVILFDGPIEQPAENDSHDTAPEVQPT